MATQSAPTSSNGIIFIDGAVADAESLIENQPPGLEVVLLDSAKDGIDQITDALQSRSSVDSVHIVSHGDTARLFLGSTVLDTDSLSAYSSNLQQWRSFLSEDADVLLYGCDVGQGLDGQLFLNQLSSLTGADIAASDDITGSSGDWELEQTTGQIENPLAFSQAALDEYSGNLKIITVTSASDRGAGSLRAAIAQAADGDTIRFASTLANKTIKLTSGELYIDKDLTIDATGVANLKVSGENKSQVFQVGLAANPVSAILKNLTIVNGNPRPGESGGGIHVGNFGAITLIDCQLNNNKADRGGALQLGSGVQATIIGCSFDGNDGSRANNGFSGGAISTNSAGGAGGPGFLVIENSRFTNNKGYNGGAVYNISNPVTIKNSVFLNNSATGNGGGAIFSDGAGPSGPGTTSGGTVQIENSWFENNQAKGGGGALFIWGYGKDKLAVEDTTILDNTVTRSARNLARGGGIEANGGQITLRNVAIADNVADSQGGGFWVQTKLAVDITNSTFSGNRAIVDAGGALFLNTADETPVNIVNSTIAYNEAGRANGALWTNAKNSDDVTLRNSIVAFNRAGDHNQHQVGFTLRDGGGNIEYPAPTGRYIRVTPNSRIIDPQIGALTQIGDDWVHPLLPGSPAINKGVSRSNVPSIDQLGLDRDGQPDIGAFEFQTATIQESTVQATTDPITDSQVASDDAIGEYGSLSLNHQWQTVSLDAEYRNPVVIVSDPTFNGGDPAVTRLRNVTGNSFQIRLQEPNYKDGKHVKESVSYLVVEAGDWTLADGTRISAGTRSSSRLTSKGFDAQSLSDFKLTPTVLTQVQTFNGRDWVTTRTTGQSSSGFKFGMEEEEALNRGGHVGETIGWLAIDQGTASDGDTLLQGGTTSRSFDHDRSTVNLAANFEAAPSLIAKLGSYYGSDTANLRLDSITKTSFGVRVQEEQSLDGELSHTNESIAFVALQGKAGVLSGLAV
ncbi:hypothetical protein C7271_09395 [filamentous cyanobacterium CCP5]|nr:hypothetical protein C7271_09395 [filamentous cyanobacterium CCP5]